MLRITIRSNGIDNDNNNNKNDNNYNNEVPTWVVITKIFKKA